MKKRLNILLVFALVFSMLAPAFAFAAETTAELTTEQKFEALKQAGVFEGLADGSAGLDQDMNRGQLAKVLALVYGLELLPGQAVPGFNEPTDSQFYKDGYIQAVVKAGLMIGGPKADGTVGFRPNDKFTVQELAVVLARALELKVEANATVEGKVADWAKGQVAAAIQAGLLKASADYTVPAKRALLVEAAFAVKTAFDAKNVPAQATVKEVKATGAKKVTVEFTAAVKETSKVKFTVSRGAATSAIAETKWADDKKSVVLVLESNFRAGTYTVKVDVEEGTNAVAASKEITVTDERIAKVEFDTNSEFLPQTADVLLTFKAYNQYDEVSDLPASRFTVSLSNNTATVQNRSGEKQEFTVRTNGLVKDNTLVITVIAPNATAQATKVFKIGDPASVATIELGEVTFEAGQTKLTQNKTASIAAKAFDQYGHGITDAAIINTNTTRISTNPSVVANADVVFANVDSKLVLNVTTNATVRNDADVTVTVYAHASGKQASKELKVFAPKAPHDVTFGNLTGVVAVGDSTKYIPIVVTDQNGEKLSAEDIVAHAADFTIFSTNTAVVATAAIQTTGEHKGKVAVSTFNNTGTATITVLVNKTAKQATYSVDVQERRAAASVYVHTQSADKYLPGSESEIKFRIKDQYGADINANFTDYKVSLTLTKSSGTNDAIVVTDGTTTLNNADNTETFVAGDISTFVYDKAWTVDSANADTGVFTLTARLIKVEGGNDTVLSTATKRLEAIPASAADSLTYSVTEVGKVFAAKATGAYSVGNATLEDHHAKEITIEAKDASGLKVAIPAAAIKSITSSNTGVLEVVAGNKVIGKANGTANVTVVFEPSVTGSKFATQTIEVSNVAPVVDKVVAQRSARYFPNAETTLNNANAWNTDLMGNVDVFDQYGTRYRNAEIEAHKAVLGVQFLISNVKWSEANTAPGTLTVNATTGVITYAANGTNVIKSFTLTVVSPNGKSASTDITTN